MTAMDIQARGAFRPHAIIAPERSVPEPIFVAAIIGVERLLLIKLNRSRGEDSYVEQAKAGICRKLNGIPFRSPACVRQAGGLHHQLRAGTHRAV